MSRHTWRGKPEARVTLPPPPPTGYAEQRDDFGRLSPQREDAGPALERLAATLSRAAAGGPVVLTIYGAGTWRAELRAAPTAHGEEAREVEHQLAQLYTPDTLIGYFPGTWLAHAAWMLAHALGGDVEYLGTREDRSDTPGIVY